MGTNDSFHGVGQEQPTNGHDDIYGPASWRDYILNKRPKNVRAKRAVVLFSVDIIMLGILIGIIKTLTESKELLAFIVSIAWVAGRTVIIAFKILSFWGKHSESIQRGIRAIKEMFKE
jgi:hypothetical protein